MPINADPYRVIEKLQQQNAELSMRAAVLESAVDQLTEKNDELTHLMDQVNEKEHSHEH